jgi:hypothetical protein
MIHSSRRDRKTKQFPKRWQCSLTPTLNSCHIGPRPVRETDEWLWESATEFCASLDRYAGRYGN